MSSLSASSLRGVLLALLLPAASLAVPHTLGYEGRLLQDGLAPSATVSITFALYDAATNGSQLWGEDQQLALTDGFYGTYLGAVNPIPATVFDGTDRYLEVTVNGETLTPRERIGAQAYAYRSEIATSVQGGVVDASRVSVNGSSVIDSTGHLAGNAAYQAGPGIVIDPATNTISLPQACAAGQILSWDGAQWSCTAAAPTYLPGSGLELSNGAFELLSSCAAGQLLKWNGTSWACAADQNAGGTVTSVVANSPLVVSGTNNAPVISIAPASSASDGFLSAADWVRFDAGQKVQGIPIGQAAPATGQVLKFDGHQWTPAVDANAGGTVTSVLANAPVSVANGNNVPVISLPRAGASADGYLASADWTTFSNKIDNGASAGGDLSGRLPAPTVSQLQGSPVSAVAPALNQTLVWNGTAWTPKIPPVTGVSVSSPLALSQPATVPAISISKSDASTDGYLAKGDFSTFAAKVGPATQASGDLSGTFTTLSIAAIQGNAVNAPSPTSGQMLAFDGSQWMPTTPVSDVSASSPLTVTNGTTTPALSITKADASTDGYLAKGDFTTFAAKVGPATQASGDLSGTFTTLSIAAIQGNTVNAAAPTAGQVLQFDGSQWTAVTPVSTVSGSGPITVTSGGTTPTISIARADASTDGYLAASDFASFNNRIAIGATAGGDLTGALPSPTIASLQGKPVSASSPATGQVLKWNGTAWTPQADANSGGTVTSVGLTVPAGFAVSGSPVTTTGTLGITTTLSGLVMGNGSGFTTATAGTDYLTPTGSGAGLTSLNASSLASGTVPASVLPTTGVTAGSYTNVNVTVDTTGRITAIANGSGGVPSGAIVAFYSTNCPSGWSPADGSSAQPDLRGRFPLGLNGAGNPSNYPASLGQAGGTWQYRIGVDSNQFACCAGDQGINGVYLEWWGESALSTTGSDDSNSYHYTGYTTHLPPYVTVLWCVKN